MLSRRHNLHTASVYLANYRPPVVKIPSPLRLPDSREGVLNEKSYTRRRLGGRQPLWGTRVTSVMDRTSNPAAARARTADSRPDPGPFTRTWTVRIPWSRAVWAARDDACCAANGVPLREPRNPIEPELDQQSVLPFISAILIMVLLKVAWIKTIPSGTTRRSFFRLPFFFPAGFAMSRVPSRRRLEASPSPGSSSLRYVLAIARFLFATAPRRGPLRVRALVCVRCPRAGSPRRWRNPR